MYFTLQPRIISEGKLFLTNTDWNKALSTLAQQDGVRNVFWGQTIESQDKVYLLIGMSPLKCHQDFHHANR